MAVERAVGGSSLVEVIDRVLDKGIVVDAWVRVSLVGIELVTVEARVVIASVDTYLRYADAISGTPQISRPTPRAVEDSGRYDELASEIAGLRAQLAAPTASQPVIRAKAVTRTRREAAVLA
jgi:gas vesicle structural protein